MPYTRVPQQRASLLERWARTAYRARWRVLGAWVLVLAGLTAANLLFGGTFVSEFRVPGAESQHARDLLAARFPARSGDTSDLVFETPEGVASSSARPRIQSVLDEVAGIKPAVVSIDSPFDQARLISGDGTIARATVHWNKRSSDVAQKDVDTMLGIVDRAKGHGITVEAGGIVVQQHENP